MSDMRVGDKITWIAECDDPEMPKRGDVGTVIKADEPGRGTAFMVEWPDGGISIECDLDERHLFHYGDDPLDTVEDL